MVAITYGVARVPAVDAAPEAKTVAAAPRKHWFARLIDAMMVARMAQAQREIRMYTRISPYTPDEPAHGAHKADTNATPFGGW